MTITREDLDELKQYCGHALISDTRVPLGREAARKFLEIINEVAAARESSDVYWRTILRATDGDVVHDPAHACSLSDALEQQLEWVREGGDPEHDPRKWECIIQSQPADGSGEWTDHE